MYYLKPLEHTEHYKKYGDKLLNCLTWPAAMMENAFLQFYTL
jgi:hypothetical protein